MFIRNLNKIFLIITLVALALLFFLWYKDYTFKKYPLDEKILRKIDKKANELFKKSYLKYNIDKKFPIIISDKMPNKLLGLAVFNKNKNILIYLNKKRFKEDINYMLDSVLPHEYAHAIMFAKKDFTKENAGHSKKWQDICIFLGGKKCSRFANNHDIILNKSNPFK